MFTHSTLKKIDVINMKLHISIKYPGYRIYYKWQVKKNV